MKMRKVLAEKINRKHPPIYSISYNTSVKDAAAKLCQEKIGAMMVEMQQPAFGQYAGIVSERDILKCCAFKENFQDIPISSIMKTEMITADIEEPALTVIKRMTDSHIRHIPLVDNGKIIALISIRDLMYCVDMQKDIMLDQLNDLLGATRRNQVY